MPHMNSEAWLTKAADTMVHDIFEPAGFETNGNTGDPLSEKLRARVGYPLAHALRKDIKAIGMCMPSAASAGGFSEIFISPVLGKGSPMPGGDNPRVILATLAHEIGHAAAGYAAGHGPVFQAVMEGIKLSLVGTDMRVAGSQESELTPEFKDYADKLIKKLGEYDHYSITTETMPHASTKLLKQVCVNDACPGHVGNRRRSNRITWYWAKQGTEFCGQCKERMSVYLPRAKGAKGKGAGERDPNAVPTCIDTDGSMTDTPLSDNPNPNTPFHTDPDDDEPTPGGDDDEPTDEPADDDAVIDEPTDDDEPNDGKDSGKQTATPTEGSGNDHAKGNSEPLTPGGVAGKGKPQVIDSNGCIEGPHSASMTCKCEACKADRAKLGI